MRITNRFFKRSMPMLVAGEVFFRKLSGDANTVRMFIRVVGENDNPSRVCVQMTQEEARSMHNAMLEEFWFLEDPK